MAEKFTITLNREVVELAKVELHINFGIAMERWSTLERALYYWFGYLTGLKPKIARAIFYSARGFYARTDMLEALIEHVTPSNPLEIEFLKEALKKAKQYSPFRNKLAHGERHLNVIEGHEHLAHYKIVQGKNMEDPISLSDMATFSDNIGLLHDCLLWMHPKMEKPANAKPPAECLALVRALPNQPNSKNDPIPSESDKPHQEPPLRNKKTFRAEQAKKATEE